MITLFNDDCLEVFKQIPDESIDCVVTDCPYHIVSGGCTNDAVKIGRTRECGGMLTKRKTDKGNYLLSGTKHVTLCGNVLNDSITYTKQGKLFEFNEIEFSEWLPELYRVLKPDTHCYIMINARNLKDLQTDAEAAGFVFQQLIVWDKGNTVPNKFYLNAYELILMLRKGKARNINYMGTTNILRVPNIIKKKKHPTEKPAALMRILIENSTNQGDTVLDPFMGVGGTGIACKEAKRDFIGIEIDEKYFNIANYQINEADKENAQMTIEQYWGEE